MSSARILKTGPALLMLLLVTAGLITMHTLGHFAMPTTHATHTTHTTHATHATHTGGQADLVAGYQLQAAPAPEEPVAPMGSMVMCVAILCALTGLAVAALLMRRLRALSLPAQLGLHRVIDAVRGPPAIRIGLALTHLSVLRT